MWGTYFSILFLLPRAWLHLRWILASQAVLHSLIFVGMATTEQEESWIEANFTLVEKRFYKERKLHFQWIKFLIQYRHKDMEGLEVEDTEFFCENYIFPKLGLNEIPVL